MVDRNESGDRLDGLKDDPLPLPPLPEARGLPPGAIGFNESGDPVFPKHQGPMNEAGDVIFTETETENSSVNIQEFCKSCGGRGKWMELDGHNVLQPKVCKGCNGMKFER